jgi:hypothetical protein
VSMNIVTEEIEDVIDSSISVESQLRLIEDDNRAVSTSASVHDKIDHQVDDTSLTMRCGVPFATQGEPDSVMEGNSEGTMGSVATFTTHELIALEIFHDWRMKMMGVSANIDKTDDE